MCQAQEALKARAETHAFSDRRVRAGETGSEAPSCVVRLFH
jgi:hypothetical protein